MLLQNTDLCYFYFLIISHCGIYIYIVYNLHSLILQSIFGDLKVWITKHIISLYSIMNILLFLILSIIILNFYVVFHLYIYYILCNRLCCYYQLLFNCLPYIKTILYNLKMVNSTRVHFRNIYRFSLSVLLELYVD